MPELFPIAVFPEGALSSSVTTTVLIGVWVLAFFNLRFGWTLSALVVPGYLVPLMIVKPITVVVIVLEGVITYQAAHALSEWVRLRGCWTSFFGRDRFFLIVLLSVVVRLLFDGLLLPHVGARFPAWRIDLHSFGLVVVPLIANFFWKPGVGRGLIHLQVLIWVTWLITRYVVIPCTNFRMSGLFYMYEDAAASMLSSPKSYMLLITTAWLASRVNLRYGWEYSGILIPALLALEWITPLKIAASLFEACVILVGARLLLATPLLRGMTVEGARKIVLFFTIGYLWRLFLGFHLHAWQPEWQASDVYGFGYLLSTLLAIKAHDRDAAIRIAGATLRICGTGGVLGCAIGFGLTFAPAAPLLLSDAIPAQSATAAKEEFRADLDSQLRADKVRLYAAVLPGRYAPASETERNAFDLGLRALLEPGSDDADRLDRGARWLNAAGMDVGVVGDRYWYIRERSPVHGRGLYVIDRDSSSELVVAVPDPLRAPQSIEVGLELLRRLEARALLIGQDRLPGIDLEGMEGGGDAQTCFARAAHLVSGGNLLFVMGPTLQEPARDRMWVKRGLPAGLNINVLKSVLPDLTVSWESPPGNHGLLEEFWRGVAVLNLSTMSRLRIASDSADAGVQRYQQPLSSWLLDQKDRIAVEGSGAYRPATLEEVLLLDYEVVTPLLEISAGAASLSDIGTRDVLRLRQAAVAVAAMDLELAALVDDSSGHEFLILRDAPGEQGRHWGTFVFRLGAVLPAIFEISRPLAELRTLEFGATLYDATDSFGLLAPGAHLRANPDGSADMLFSGNRVSLFHLVRQVILRETGTAPLLFLQVRGARFPFAADSVLSPGQLAHNAEELPPLTRHLQERLQTQLGVTAILNGTLPEAGGYTVSWLYAHTMRSQPASREVASLWLSEDLRQGYRPVADSTLMEDQFIALGIPIREGDLTEHLLAHVPDSGGIAGDLPAEGVRRRLKSALAEYIASEDILLLRQLQHEFADWDWLRLRDAKTDQPFLILSTRDRSYQLVVNLAPGLADAAPEFRDTPTAANLQQFLQRRERWIEFGRRP